MEWTRIIEITESNSRLYFYEDDKNDTVKNSLIFSRNQTVRVRYLNGHIRPHILYIQNMWDDELSTIYQDMGVIEFNSRIVILINYNGVRVSIPIINLEIQINSIKRFHESIGVKSLRG